MLSTIGTELLATSAGEMSAGRIWIGWFGLTAAFMLFDAGAKFAKPAQVVEAFARTGWPMRLSSTLGAILLTCTVFYLCRRLQYWVQSCSPDILAGQCRQICD